jgi:hypothetical protein
VAEGFPVFIAQHSLGMIRSLGMVLAKHTPTRGNHLF